jgi:aminopeptidase N
MPLALGLLGRDGQELPLLPKENVTLHDGVLELTEAAITLTFRNIRERPALSINRGFSSPINLQSDASDDDLLMQMAHDRDSFNRWEAAQTSARRLLLKAYHGQTFNVSAYAAGLKQTLSANEHDDAFKALMLQMPGEAEITAVLGQNVDAMRVHATRNDVLKSLSTLLVSRLRQVLQDTAETGTYRPDTKGTGRRSLRLAALALLSYAEPAEAVAIARRDFADASNMTMKAGALGAVLRVAGNDVDMMLEQFFEHHSNDHLLVDKWFMLMAAKPSANAAARIETLTKLSAFSFKTPNRIYALIGGFTGGNLAGFHASDGSGYKLLADVIIRLNGINPQVASRMATSFRSWKQYDNARKARAQAEMQRILASQDISNDVYEIISRTLA